MGQGISLKSEMNNPWFNIILHTQSIVCATVDSQCLDYLGYITLTKSLKNPESAKVYTIYIKNQDKVELKITRRLRR